MSFQQSLSVNLQKEQTVIFIQSNKSGASLTFANDVPTDFSKVSSRDVGNTPMKVYWSRFVECGIYQGYQRPALISKSEIKILAWKKVRVEVFADLIVNNTVTPQQLQEIQTAFKAFDYAVDGDPNEYIDKKIVGGTTVSRKMFRVDLTYKIVIDGDVETDDRALTHFLDYWKGKYSGSIGRQSSGEDKTIGEYLEETQLFAQTMANRDVPLVAPDLEDPDKIVTDFPEDTARDRAKKDLQAADCGHTRTDAHKIADLLHWIEVKIIWSEGRIDLGCGNYLTFQYPEFRSREVAYVLYASLTLPEPTDEDKERAVLECFWTSVFAATVVGIALANPKPALIAFKALFLECIIRKFKKAISCISVDLFIKVEIVHDWH
jgi:hypothetical protein